MSQYDQILRENSSIKKELSLCQLKVQTLKGEHSQISYDADNLRSLNAKYLKENQQLKNEVQSLQRDKKQIQTTYEQTINEIKRQIDSKQQELENIQNKVSPSFDYAIMRMKITHELEAEFTPRLEAKEEELVDLKSRISDVTRQVQLLQEKLRLKEKSTNNIIEQMKQNHLLEIQNITKTIVESNKQYDNPIRQINKKLKRQVTELRERLMFKDKQLEDIYLQKMNLKQRMNQITISLNQSALKSRQQSKIVRNQYQSMARVVGEYQAKREQDRILGTQKDRQIKKLKNRLQQLEDDNQKKQKLMKKLEELADNGEIELQKLKGQMANENVKMNHEILKNTINVLQKDLETLRFKFEETKKQNKELKEQQLESRKEIGNLNSQLDKKIKDKSPSPRNNTDDVEDALKKQGGAYQKIIKALKRQIEKINDEKKKAEEKGEKNKNLLREANSKILELIQHKIVTHQSDSPQPRQPVVPISLPSPTPTVKRVFEFQSEGRYLPNQGRFNPEARLQPNIQNQFYASHKSLNRSRSPVPPTFRVQQMAQKTLSAAGGGKSSFEFYEMAKRIEPRKISPACGHKHH